MFAIVDCNNFYASCERLFKPALKNKAIVVLSNNDGCVIARSNEAKALGIKMGEPFFQVKSRCQTDGLVVFSSNYAFYGDMSSRVMQVIEASWPEIEIYSIDEAFLDLSALPSSQHLSFCDSLQEKIFRYTGIPVSIGIGKTKTLAKLANAIAKKKLKIPVFTLTENESWLKKINIEDIWGVGRRYTKHLNALGIMTAEHLKTANDAWIRKKFNVMLGRTVLELRGVPCMGLEISSPKKSIVSSRSFGEMQTEFNAVASALSAYSAIATEKLRQQESRAAYISVFITTNRFRKDMPQYTNQIGVQLIHASSDTRVITKQALLCLKRVFKKGYHYKKVGILLDKINPRSVYQQDLFCEEKESDSLSSVKVMDMLDRINERYGSHTLKLASEGFDKKAVMRQSLRSPSYTTSWLDLPLVKL